MVMFKRNAFYRAYAITVQERRSARSYQHPSCPRSKCVATKTMC